MVPIPKYRLKSEEEMAWNAIRRAVTAELRLQASAWLEKRLNDVLPALQVEFQKTLNAGALPELEANHKAWVKDSLAKAQRDLGEDQTG